MKRFLATFMTVICLFSLAACGSQKPSLEEVEQAIEEGNLTIEDALEKKWVTQEWVDDYFEKNSIPANNKMESGAVDEFKTTTITGEEFTKEQLGDVTLFAFIDPSDPDAKTFFNTLKEGYAGVKDNGAEIIVCIENEENTEFLADAPFPVILYNDSVKAATKNHRDMIEDTPNAASWYVNGAFLSAWYTTLELDDLADDAASFVELQKEISDPNNNENDGMNVVE